MADELTPEQLETVRRILTNHAKVRRVRMPPRRGDIASAMLLNVVAYLKEEKAFEEYITEDVVKHILGWARRCREGRYEDLSDVEMYKHDGYDSDGLDLWLRNRGSKAENFHQKMHAAAGPFGFSVETAHYLQVILSYQYLVNARVRRCDEPDFGHFMLHLEDEIQLKIQRIWAVDLFPHRINLSEQTPLNFVAVGVGLLSLDENYVTIGKPAKHLKGDPKFMAERMGVEIPPLPPSTPKEYRMIKDFFAQHPQPNQEDIRRLCRSFKAQANGIDIFPKLPEMIPPALKRWKINEETNLLELSVGEGYRRLIESMKSNKISLPPPNPQHQQELSVAAIPNADTKGEGNEPMLQQLSPVFVPPICAPSQTSSIPVHTSTT